MAGFGRVGGGAAVAMVVASALVLGPHAQVAKADVVAPSPVQVPGSVLSQAGTLSDAGWNAVIQQTTGKTGAGYTLPAQVSETASLGGKGAMSGAGGVVGGAVAGLMALMQGLDMGHSIAYATGISKNESWECDMRVLITKKSCTFGSAPSYVVNSDVTVNPEGWTGPPKWQWVIYGPGVGNGSPWWTLPTQSGWSAVEIHDAQPYGSSQIPTVVRNGPAVAPGYTTNSNASVDAYCLANGVVGPAQCSQSGEVFDHFQFTGISDVPDTTQWGHHFEYEPGPSRSDHYDWYPVGHPSRPAQQDADPERTWVTTWKCSDGSAGSASSPSFHETDPEWPGFAPAECDGSAVTSVKIVEQRAGSADVTTMYDWEASQAQKDWDASDCARASSPCTLLLTRTDAQTGTRISCFDNPSLCVDWWTETQQATSTTSDYKCTYGATEVALNECATYSQLFKTGVYANPTTGSAPTPAPDPSQPQQDNTCPPPFTWTSLMNPWWYYKGAVCALEQVFVPKGQLQTAKVTTAWNSSSLGQLGTVVGNLGAGFASIGGGECGVITDSEPVPLLGWHLVVDTCAWPWSAAGPLKRIIGIAFLLGAVVIGVRTVLRIIRADVVVDGGEK